jgi:glycosyltransferase involved in cell wall biosynthesis
MIKKLCADKKNREITCFFNSFVGISGGDVRFVQIFSRVNNLEKTVVTPLLGKEFCQSEGLKATYIITTNESNFTNVIATYALRIARALSLKLKTKEAAILYSASDFLPDVLPAFLQKRKSKNTWVQVIHHVIPAKRQGSPLTNLISYSAQRISFFLIKKYADLVITVSPVVKDNLVEMGFCDDRLEINANGVEIAYFKNLPSNNKIAYDGVFIGRLHASKGIFDLVKLWKIICGYKSVRLGIIGNGDSKTKLALRAEIEKEKLSNNIDVLCCLANDEAFGILKSSKVFVFPSHEEGFGIAILEAMACGLPVVAWDLPVYKEIFRRGIILVPKEHFAEMAQETLKLIEDDTLRVNIGNEALQTSKKYSWANIVSRELSLIDLPKSANALKS